MSEIQDSGQQEAAMREDADIERVTDSIKNDTPLELRLEQIQTLMRDMKNRGMLVKRMHEKRFTDEEHQKLVNKLERHQHLIQRVNRKDFEVFMMELKNRSKSHLTASYADARAHLGDTAIATPEVVNQSLEKGKTLRDFVKPIDWVTALIGKIFTPFRVIETLVVRVMRSQYSSLEMAKDTVRMMQEEGVNVLGVSFNADAQNALELSKIYLEVKPHRGNGYDYRAFVKELAGRIKPRTTTVTLYDCQEEARKLAKEVTGPRR